VDNGNTARDRSGSGSGPWGRLLAGADLLDRLIAHLCRFLVLATGIALTAILAGNVVARYAFASGGINAAQELPEQLFPWVIVAGITLAAQAGAHMSVDWLLVKLDTRGSRALLLLGNAIVLASYLVLFHQAMMVADIAWVERSPVLGLPNSYGYWAIALGCILLAVTTACASLRIALGIVTTRTTVTDAQG
jgi:TRAP-type C4-dicarboxylate transport system permease small subunit